MICGNVLEIDMKNKFFACFAVLAALLPLQALAASVSFMGSGVSGGVNVSASAVFTLSPDGKTLSITLKNTSAQTPSPTPQDQPASTLTGLFWNSASNAVLTTVSALATSIITPTLCINPASCSGSNVNVAGEFGYQGSQVSGSPSGTNRGIGAAGYITTGIAGNIGNFNNGGAGTNLFGTDSLGGIDFGIISSAYALDPNGGLSGRPLVQDAVTFMFTSSVALTTADISQVTFVYGTAANEFNVPGGPPGKVPEPGTLALLGLGMAGLVAGQKRKAARAAQQAA